MNERLLALTWIAVSSVLAVAGQTIAKLGLARLELGAGPRIADALRMLGSPLVAGGTALLAASLLLWFHALSKIEFSIAMPVGALLQLVLSIAAARLFFGESMPLARWAGFALALVAVALIAKGR